MPKAVVIGAGIIGMTSAIALQRVGFKTTIVAPREYTPGASWGNAGHIALEQSAPLASIGTLCRLPQELFLAGGPVDFPLRDMRVWLPFAIRVLQACAPRRFETGKAALSTILGNSKEAWVRLVQSLNRPDLLLETGHFIAWKAEAAAAGNLARWQFNNRTVEVNLSSPEQLKRIASLVRTPIRSALHFAGTGQISDLRELLNALKRRFLYNGGVRVYDRVTTLRRKDQTAVAVLGTHATEEADILLVAAGVCSSKLLSPLGLDVPLIAERGYHVEAPAVSWPRDLGPIVFADRGVIVTPFNTGLRVAGFCEFGRFDSPPLPRKWTVLKEHAKALGLPFQSEPTEWMGSRPTLPDYIPAIGRCGDIGVENLCYAFGHQHLGLTLGPITAEIIAALACNRKTPIDLNPFNVLRFRCALS